MKEKGVVNFPVIALITLGVLALALGVYAYFALNGPDYTSTYTQRISDGTLQDPITEFQLSEGADNKSLSDIIHMEGFSELDLGNLETKSLNFMSVKLYLYNLHNIPLTNINPKIQIYLDETVYSVEVINGEIYINKQLIDNPDAVIRTTLDEVAKIMQNPEYAKGSINSGKTTIDITGNSLALLLKGYAKLYSKISAEI